DSSSTTGSASSRTAACGSSSSKPGEVRGSSYGPGWSAWAASMLPNMPSGLPPPRGEAGWAGAAAGAASLAVSFFSFCPPHAVRTAARARALDLVITTCRFAARLRLRAGGRAGAGAGLGLCAARRGAPAEPLDLPARRPGARAARVLLQEPAVPLDRLLLEPLLLVRLRDPPHRRLVARRDAEGGAEAGARALVLLAIEVAVAEPGQRLDAGRVGVEHLAEERHRLLAVAALRRLVGARQGRVERVLGWLLLARRLAAAAAAAARALRRRPAARRRLLHLLRLLRRLLLAGAEPGEERARALVLGLGGEHRLGALHRRRLVAVEVVEPGQAQARAHIAGRRGPGDLVEQDAGVAQPLVAHVEQRLHQLGLARQLRRKRRLARLAQQPLDLDRPLPLEPARIRQGEERRRVVPLGGQRLVGQRARRGRLLPRGGQEPGALGRRGGELRGVEILLGQRRQDARPRHQRGRIGRAGGD